MARDLTPSEARKAFNDFAAGIGTRADIFVSLARRGDDANFRASLYPKGIGDRWIIQAHGDDFAELLSNIRTAWAENSEAHALKMVREMALAIISITDEIGECTDAALRAKFDAADVARYGEPACAAATEMASNGPFSIVKLAGANDAVAA